ncbi:hypothetical protein, partial [Pseudomonas amygdali]|uniref:hypothetical protein n=1 Tax=Pseudomonas amygdali TaxID=47877 RepID=UPI001FB6A2BB
MKQMTFADAEYAGKRKQTRKELFADSTTIRTPIPPTSGHRFHGQPDTFRQAATQDYSLLSTSFFE